MSKRYEINDIKKREKRYKIQWRRGFYYYDINSFLCFRRVVYSVERTISLQMSEAAIENLSENLELLKGTIQAILNKG